MARGEKPYHYNDAAKRMRLDGRWPFDTALLHVDWAPAGRHEALEKYVRTDPNSDLLRTSAGGHFPARGLQGSYIYSCADRPRHRACRNISSAQDREYLRS